MLEKTLLDDPNFREFYVTAKRSTYAASGDQKAEILRNGGKLYVFYDEKRWPQWRYTDIYHGYNPFFGNEMAEEIGGATPSVWAPAAQMGYGGYARGTKDEVKRMFAFLERMLQRVSVESLFRGPIFSTISEDDMQYACSCDRTDPFNAGGRETIHLFSGENVIGSYVLRFQFSCLR